MIVIIVMIALAVKILHGSSAANIDAKLWRLYAAVTPSWRCTVPRGQRRSARRALAAIEPISWRGTVWRSHGLDIQASRVAGRPIYYDPASDGDSRKTSGRYHRARDRFPRARVWPALYTSLTDGGCIAEAVRHAGSLEALVGLRISSIDVTLSMVLDLTEPHRYGLTLHDVIDDLDYRVTQAIGLAALQRGVEGLLVPAASLVTINLVILTENLSTDSIIEPRSSIDPRLYVPRA